MSDARTAVLAILARDGLARLQADDVERLVALYEEIQPDLAQLRALKDLRNSEPAVIFSAE
jgi:hypothetical protein